MLLNLDKPHQAATLHSDDCSHLPQPVGSVLKPTEDMGRDGGWFEVTSLDAAESLTKRALPGVAVHECSFCRS